MSKPYSDCRAVRDMQYKELEFKSHPVMPGAMQCRIDFSNGYGASIVEGDMAFGGRELAVFKGDHICHDTPITDDVLGGLSRSDVTALLNQIASLPKVPGDA